MSQAGILSDSTTALADVESLTGDSGGIVYPDAANNIDILGGTNITTVGVPGSNSITINQDNIVLGTGQTIGAVTADIITVAAGGTAGAYQIEAHIVGFESTTPTSGAYRLVNGARTTGSATTLTGSTDKTVNEEVAFNDIDIIASGNNFIVRVTGIVGLTISWSAKLQYVFAS